MMNYDNFLTDDNDRATTNRILLLLPRHKNA